MAGSGDRRFNGLAIAVALRRMLAVAFNNARLIEVGGTELDGGLPEAAGDTDIAAGVLAAFGSRPDAVVLITDGYENRCDGDLAQLLAALTRLGVAVPVVEIVPAFTEREALDDRPPLSHARRIVEPGDRGLWGAWLRLMSALWPEVLQQRLSQRLEQLERQTTEVA